MGQAKQSNWRWLIVTLVIAVVVLIGAVAYAVFFQGKDVNSFQACKEAGGNMTQDQPQQCEINGKTFTDKADKESDSQTEQSGYIGLTEQEALDKAKQEDREARVVERDGESLLVTMDISHGRVNLTVEDGKVVDVYIERVEAKTE